MRRWTLERAYLGEVGTFGVLTTDGPDPFVCATAELPWRDNARNVSCIPEGVYPMRVRPFRGYLALFLEQVPGRDGIYGHRANWPAELRGCFAPGREVQVLFRWRAAQWLLGVTDSTGTLAELIRRADGGVELELEVRRRLLLPGAPEIVDRTRET